MYLCVALFLDHHHPSVVQSADIRSQTTKLRELVDKAKGIYYPVKSTSQSVSRVPKALLGALPINELENDSLKVLLLLEDGNPETLRLLQDGLRR